MGRSHKTIIRCTAELNSSSLFPRLYKEQLNLAAKRTGIQRGIFWYVTFNLRKEIEHTPGLDKTLPHHFSHVLKISLQIAFNFRESLSVKVVMKKRELTLLLNEAASVLPAWQSRNEVIGCSQLDVDFEALFQSRQASQEFIRFWNGF